MFLPNLELCVHTIKYLNQSKLFIGTYHSTQHPSTEMSEHFLRLEMIITIILIDMDSDGWIFDVSNIK